MKFVNCVYVVQVLSAMNTKNSDSVIYDSCNDTYSWHVFFEIHFCKKKKKNYLAKRTLQNHTKHLMSDLRNQGMKIWYMYVFKSVFRLISTSVPDTPWCAPIGVTPQRSPGRTLTSTSQNSVHQQPFPVPSGMQVVNIRWELFPFDSDKLGGVLV